MSLPKPDYINILNELKEKIRQARIKAAITVNAELLKLYWEIGNTILIQQKDQGWGAKIIDNLSADLKIAFPDFKGLSVRNLKYMRSFAEAYPAFTMVQPPAAQLPWGHHQLMLHKLKSNELRFFYMAECIENGWSRNVLSAQIVMESIEWQIERLKSNAK
jgi:predicted nuclease of restriction endonuclease-like (RecB) superfamily